MEGVPLAAGNVRQLQNTISRAVSHTRDRIISESFIDAQSGSGDEIENIAEMIDKSDGFPNLKDAVGDLERQVILKALKETKGNLTEAAQLIGLTRRELQGRMEKYEIVQE